MSAYDKLGLAMIPSGYKGEADENNAGGFLGKVYSVLPAQTTSDNLVTNGTFDADANWSKGTGWDITGGKAVCDGTQTANTTLVQQSTILGANLEILNNKTYRVTLDVTVTSGAITYIELAGGIRNDDITQSQVGLTFDMKSGSSGNDRLTIAANSSFVGSVDNVKVQLISDGDFDFSRGSDATRVNSQGYIESVQVLSDELVQNGDFEEVGSELITNGGFDTDSDWVTTASVTIENGQASFNSTPAYEFALRQTVSSVVINKIYKVSFDLTVESGNVAVYLKDPPSNSPTLTESGTYTYYFKATNNELRFRVIDLGFTGSIDNISVKEVGQNWTFGTGWNITDDGGNLKVEGDGTMTSADVLDYTYNFTDNNKYRFTFTISNHQSGSVYLREPFDGSADAVNEDGTYSFDYIAGANNVMRFRSNDGFTGNIDNVSVVEVTDDTDIPRLDYSDGCPALLLEPQRTNLVTPSNDFQSWYGTSNLNITQDSTTSPEGTNNASTITSTSTGNAFVREAVTVNNAGDATFSFFAKYDTSQYISAQTRFFNNAEEAKVWFDLQNGTKGTSTGDSVDYSIVSYGDNWYRCSVTWNIDASDLNGYCYIYLSDVDGSNTTSVGKFAYIYGAQLEEGSYATSYIPTNGSTVTRLADVCNNAGDSTIFNDDEGVLFADIKGLANESTGWNAISLNDGSHNDSIGISWVLGSDTQVRFLVRSGGVGQMLYLPNVLKSEYHKVAIKYKANDFAVWIDGYEAHVDNIGIVPTGLNTISFDRGGGSDIFQGNTRSLLYFNEALTDEELEALTSSNIDQVLKNYQTIGERLGATYESTYVKTKLNELF